MKSKSISKNSRPIIFYDGICNLCSRTVEFLLKLDRKNKFRFIALQSADGKEMMKTLGDSISNVDSVILLKENKVYVRSKAIFEIIGDTGGFLKVLLIFRIFPDRFNDYFYDLLARNRYVIFGKRKECFIADR